MTSNTISSTLLDIQSQFESAALNGMDLRSLPREVQVYKILKYNQSLDDNRLRNVLCENTTLLSFWKEQMWANYWHLFTLNQYSYAQQMLTLMLQNISPIVIQQYWDSIKDDLQYLTSETTGSSMHMVSGGSCSSK